MRYHIHPLTGQPGKCRAKKQCPFGDLATEHYDSPQEAEAAFEERMAEEEVAVPWTKTTPLNLQLLLREAHREVATLEDPALRHLGQSLLRELARFRTIATFKAAVAQVKRQGAPGDGRAKLMASFLREVASLAAEDVTPAEVAYRRSYLERSIATEEKFLALPDISSHLRAYHEDMLARDREELSHLPLTPSPGDPKWEALQEEATARMRREARERLRGYFRREEVPVAPGEELFASEAFTLTYVDEEAALRSTLAPSLFYQGRVSPEDYREACTKLGQEAQELTTLLHSEELAATYLDRRGAAAPGSPQEQALAEAGFAYLGRGIEQTAFLSRESGMVYKVRVGVRGNRHQGEADPLAREHESSQSHYMLVDQGALAAHDAEYVPTYFLTTEGTGGRPVSVVAQPYLDPAEYVPAEDMGLGDVDPHLNDLHEGNMRRSVTTGKLVLFDCIY